MVLRRLLSLYIALLPSARCIKTASPLFDETFTIGLQGWRGKSGVAVTAKNASLATGAECPGGVGSCMRLGGCTFQGAVFSVSAFLCTLEDPCTVSFQHRGGLWQGFSDGFSGRHIWTATPRPEAAGGQIVTTPMSNEWMRTVYQFPTQPNFVWN